MSDGPEGRVRTAVVAALGEIAPEVDVGAIDGGADLREEADLDSVDFMNLIVAMHASLGVEVPEADYERLGTLDGLMGYLVRRLEVSG